MSRLIVQIAALKDHPVIKRFLFDADILVYTIGFAVEDHIEWPDGEVEVYCDLNAARRLVDNRVAYFQYGVSQPVDLVLSSPSSAGLNWRNRLVDPLYKSHRPRKPVGYKAIREHIQEHHKALISEPGTEADDLLSTMVTEDPTAAIISFDKDFFTTPGWFIHLGTKALYQPSIEQALCFLMFQGLAGDRVDGYYGVDYIGPAKTRRLLLWCEAHCPTIRAAYLALKRSIKAREKKTRSANNLWAQFRQSLSMASLLQHGEEPVAGIGVGRVFKHRNRPFKYFLPFIDPGQTRKHSLVKL